MDGLISVFDVTNGFDEDDSFLVSSFSFGEPESTTLMVDIAKLFNNPLLLLGFVSELRHHITR